MSKRIVRCSLTAVQGHFLKVYEKFKHELF